MDFNSRGLDRCRKPHCEGACSGYGTSSDCPPLILISTLYQAALQAQNGPSPATVAGLIQ